MTFLQPSQPFKLVFKSSLTAPPKGTGDKPDPAKSQAFRGVVADRSAERHW